MKKKLIKSYRKENCKQAGDIPTVNVLKFKLN